MFSSWQDQFGNFWLMSVCLTMGGIILVHLNMIEVVFKLGLSEHFGPKKPHNIHKDFELYQVLMHNFLCQNILISSLYILLIRGINIFWSGGIATVRHRKSQTKNWRYLQRVFELYQFFMHKSLCQTVPKFQFYILFIFFPNYILRD